jgi:hypothetical protein
MGSRSETRPRVKDHYRVLVMGSSDVTYSDSGESGGLPALVRTELPHRFPGIEWHVDQALLYPTASMAARAEQQIDLAQPEVVYLSMGANTFVEKSVVNAIRRKLPLLYPLARFLTARTKSLAGGRAEGDPGVLGVLFRAPRGLGRRLIGLEPLLDLTRPWSPLRKRKCSRVGMPTVVRLAEGNTQQVDQRKRRRSRGSNEAVTALCRRYGFQSFAFRKSWPEVRTHARGAFDATTISTTPEGGWLHRVAAGPGRQGGGGQPARCQPTSLTSAQAARACGACSKLWHLRRAWLLDGDYRSRAGRRRRLAGGNRVLPAALP